MMMAGARGSGRKAPDSQSFKSQFDPIELYGTQIPFIDPFSYDDCAFQPSRSLSICEWPRHLIPNPIQASLFQDPQRIPAIQLNEYMTLQRTPSLTGPVMQPKKLSKALKTDRIRLNPDQAIHIFHLGRTKTAGTAALLAIEYGVSSKAIRDIWTRKSWAQDTRPYWID